MHGWGSSSVGNTVKVTTQVGLEARALDVHISSQLHVQGHPIGNLQLTT